MAEFISVITSSMLCFRCKVSSGLSSVMSFSSSNWSSFTTWLVIVSILWWVLGFSSWGRNGSLSCFRQFQFCRKPAATTWFLLLPLWRGFTIHLQIVFSLLQFRHNSLWELVVSPAELPDYGRDFHACGGFPNQVTDDKQSVQSLQVEIRRLQGRKQIKHSSRRLPWP